MKSRARLRPLRLRPTGKRRGGPMEIRDLEYLAASATAGNFARAAASVGISTSTISRRVARLEDQLGLALFERGHSGVRLTPGGRTVMQHVRRVLGELEALKSSGSVRSRSTKTRRKRARSPLRPGSSSGRARSPRSLASSRWRPSVRWPACPASSSSRALRAARRARNRLRSSGRYRRSGQA